VASIDFESFLVPKGCQIVSNFEFFELPVLRMECRNEARFLVHIVVTRLVEHVSKHLSLQAGGNSLRWLTPLGKSNPSGQSLIVAARSGSPSKV